MKVNPSQSQPIWSKPNVAHKGGSTASTPAAAATTGASETESLSLSEIAKMEHTVKKLMAESAVRPEVITGRTPEDPIKAFDEETLRRFISALREEP